MNKNIITQYVLRFALLLLISGCISTPPTDVFLGPVPTHTVLPTSTAAPTTTPTFVVTPTLIEATPAQTATTDERKNYFSEFLSNNGGCRLPCWWSITPGQTLGDVERAIHRLGGVSGAVFPGYDPGTTVYGVGGLPLTGATNTSDVYFEEKDGLVYAWHITSTGYQYEEFRRLWKNYSPQKIVAEYGMPDRILLWAFPSPDLLRYGVYSEWLFYDELGFSIRYDARIPKYFSGAPFFRICSNDPLLEIELNMQSPDNGLPLDRFDKILEDIRLGTDTGKLRLVHSLQEATNLNDMEIYNIFIQDEEPCFAIPSDIWLTK
jgi:hypothetical protein